MSRPGTAPCGHPGTYVTANFIACDLRCGFGDAPRAIASPRKEPGHVDMCACAPCQVRRRAVYIVLTTKDGSQAQLPWNGVDNRVTWTPPYACSIRHWALTDINGDDVATGHASFDLIGGRTAHVNIELFMDALAKAMLTIEQSRQTFRQFDPKNIKVTFGGIECTPYDIGAGEYRVKAPENVTTSRPWLKKMTADEILVDLQTAFAKHYCEPNEQPDTLLFPGSLFDQLLRVTAERSAELYEMMERQLFETSPAGLGR